MRRGAARLQPRRLTHARVSWREAGRLPRPASRPHRQRKGRHGSAPSPHDGHSPSSTYSGCSCSWPRLRSSSRARHGRLAGLHTCAAVRAWPSRTWSQRSRVVAMLIDALRPWVRGRRHEQGRRERGSACGGVIVALHSASLATSLLGTEQGPGRLSHAVQSSSTYMTMRPRPRRVRRQAGARRRIGERGQTAPAARRQQAALTALRRAVRPGTAREETRPHREPVRRRRRARRPQGQRRRGGAARGARAGGRVSLHKLGVFCGLSGERCGWEARKRRRSW